MAIKATSTWLKTTLRAQTAAAILAVLFGASGLGTIYLAAQQRPGARPAIPTSGVTSHVVLISVDGLRPDAIPKFQAPTLQKLMQQGSYTLSAKTILPSKTLPSHTSMLTGELPERHGVDWNDNGLFGRADIKTPTVFGVLRSRGYKTAAFFSKSKFKQLQRPGTLDYTQAPGGLFGGRWSADRTTGDVEKYLSKEKPNLLFIHLSDVDRAGHSSGWMSAKYAAAVRVADASIERIVRAAERAFGEGNFTLLVTSDHGGHDRDHGSSDPRDVHIPWIAWGRGVTAGKIQGDVLTVDTASTVLWLFDVREPTDWAGNPVMSAFTNTAD